MSSGKFVLADCPFFHIADSVYFLKDITRVSQLRKLNYA